MKAHRIRNCYDDSGLSWGIQYDLREFPSDDPGGFKTMRPLSLGRPISDAQREAFATHAVVSNLKPPSEKNLPPDLIMGATGPLFVSAAARALIETIEPDQHGFVDFELLQYTDDPENANTSRGTYHCLHLTTFLDCIDYEATHWEDGTGEKNSYGHNIADGHRVVLKPDVIAGHHIWCGVEGPPNTNIRFGGSSQHFISDELLAAFDAAGLTRNWDGEGCEMETLVAAE